MFQPSGIDITHLFISNFGFNRVLEQFKISRSNSVSYIKKLTCGPVDYKWVLAFDVYHVFTLIFYLNPFYLLIYSILVVTYSKMFHLFSSSNIWLISKKFLLCQYINGTCKIHIVKVIFKNRNNFNIASKYFNNK